GQWLAFFDGISPAETLQEQTLIGQDLLLGSGVPDQDVHVETALDLAGTFLLQTPTDVTQSAVAGELQGVPGFVFVQEFSPDDPAAPPVDSDPESPPLDINDPVVNNNDGSTGTSNFSQNTSSLVAFGNSVVAAFDDSGSAAGGTNHYTGYAYSTDGGLTFT